MLKPICVFDFETDSADELTCSPVELACVMIDPFSLEIIKGSEFSSNVKPEGIDNPDYFTPERESTIAWHCKTQKVTKDVLLEKWKTSPHIEVIWPLFVKHVEKYNKSKNQWDAPIASGINITNFDLVIAKRLNEKMKISRLFNYEIIDLRPMLFNLLIWDNELKSRSMDSLRKYFGLKSDGAHSALIDVKQEALIVARCMKYFKANFKKEKFKNSFANVDID